MLTTAKMCSGSNEVNNNYAPVLETLNPTNGVVGIKPSKNKSNLYIIKSLSFLNGKSKRERNCNDKLSSTHAAITGPLNDQIDNYEHLLRKPSGKYEHNMSLHMRPQSLPDDKTTGDGIDQSATRATKGRSFHIKPESFIRQSLKTLRRSFVSIKKPTSTIEMNKAADTDTDAIKIRKRTATKSKDNETLFLLRSSSSVNTFTNALYTGAASSTTSLASLQYIDPIALTNEHQQLNIKLQQDNYKSKLKPSLTDYADNEPTRYPTPIPKAVASKDYTISKKSLRSNSAINLNPLITVQSTDSVRTIFSSKESNFIGSNSSNDISNTNAIVSSDVNGKGDAISNRNSNTTAKQNDAMATVSGASIATEKEKKRKEMSRSRVKKFHRHFSQISKDEKLINYFSCALVSDILLQGYLYITEQHLAFYSNVFGYVTKVVIPTASVTRISKEKTAKIIPNAIGVATTDERHVFGSFISREAAYRLMCNVCPPLVQPTVATLSKMTTDSIEISEECSIEDDSSCSMSGNESTAQLHRKINGKSKLRNSELSNHAKIKPNASTNGHDAVGEAGDTVDGDPVPTSVSQTMEKAENPDETSNAPPAAGIVPTAAATASDNGTGAKKFVLSEVLKTFLNFGLPNEMHLIYICGILALILACFTLFLFCRILDIEAKANLYNIPIELINWQELANNDETLAEALQWQQQRQAKNAEEAQMMLDKNLEQISEVRRSLQALSSLIDGQSNRDTESSVDN